MYTSMKPTTDEMDLNIVRHRNPRVSRAFTSSHTSSTDLYFWKDRYQSPIHYILIGGVVAGIDGTKLAVVTAAAAHLLRQNAIRRVVE